MPSVDSRFSLDERFASEAAGESSKQALEREDASDDHHSASELDEQEENDTLGEGMDPSGFAGPKVVKPLTPEALAAFQAAQNRAGVIYISRIPPGMRPTKVRHLMSQYGEVGRVYLQQEGASIPYPFATLSDANNALRRCQTCLFTQKVHLYEEGTLYRRLGRIQG